MATVIIDPPAPMASLDEWRWHLAEIEALLEGEPGNKHLLFARDVARNAIRVRDRSATFDYSPDQPRAPAGTETGGQWIPAGGLGGMATSRNVLELDDGSKRAMADANLGKSVDQLRMEAAENQTALAHLGGEIEEKIGADFQQPPPGYEIKTADSIMRKVRDEHYAGPHQLRDISRATFVVDNPHEADLVVGALSERGKVYDRGWKLEESTGYKGRYVYLQHPNGGVSEIQLVPSRVQEIKEGQGHQLYEIIRNPVKPMEAREAAARKSRTLYRRVMPKAFYAVGQ